jgi:hypothetical protein
MDPRQSRGLLLAGAHASGAGSGRNGRSARAGSPAGRTAGRSADQGRGVGELRQADGGKAGQLAEEVLKPTGLSTSITQVGAGPAFHKLCNSPRA